MSNRQPANPVSSYAPQLLAIYCLFTLSGTVALIYEGIWARYLKLFLGHSSYGQILTLCIFMGGIGIGSFLAARFTRSLKNPFVVYAIVELLLGVGGFVYHDLYNISTQWFYDTAIGISPVMANSLKILISVLITVPMSILLGTTFPLLGVAMVRISRDGGQKAFPMLYFTNSIGAAGGILLASYYLIPTFGTEGSLHLAAIGNVIIFAGLGLIGMKLKATQGQNDERFTEIEKPPLLSHDWSQTNTYNTSVQLILWLSLLTGLSSFVYEVGWIRLLSLLLGASTHSFDIMVSSFVLGLACGGLCAKYLLSRTKHVLHLLALAQLFMGAFALCSIYFYAPAFNMMEKSRDFLDKTPQGYINFTLFKYGLSLFLMFPTTFVAGMTLPIMTYFLTNVSRNEKYVGYIYGYNTIGAIIGAIVGGLVLLPVIQLKMTIASGALVDIAIGLMLLGLYSRTKKPLFKSSVFAVLVIIPLFFVSFNPQLIAAGYFRRTSFYVPDEVVTVRDGKTATISLHVIDPIILIKTNGKTDASVGGTKGEDTQAAAAFLPMSMMDKPYDAAMIGLGSGMTAHFMLADPLMTQLDLIEIEPVMYEMAKGMLPHNSRVYNSPKIKMIYDDARTYFCTTGKKYDIITSEPSNPWISGVSSLFSVEFYHHTKRFLKPGGKLVQWMHLPEFNSDLMLSIITALESAFKHIKVYHSPYIENDVMFIASDEDFAADKFARFAQAPEIASDFAKIGVPLGYYSNRTYIADINTLKPLTEGRIPNSDYIPVLDSGAERAFFLREHVDLFVPLSESILYYQELFEPAKFKEIQKVWVDYYSNYQPDPTLQSRLSAALRTANWGSDWVGMNTALYQLMPTQLLRHLWPDMEVVKQFRHHVEIGTTPKSIGLTFKFIDNVVKQELDKNVPVIRQMLDDVKPELLSPSVIRSLAINCVLVKDKALFDQVVKQYVQDNASLSAIDRDMIKAIDQRFDSLPLQ